jgi:hypothetical protein
MATMVGCALCVLPGIFVLLLQLDRACDGGRSGLRQPARWRAARPWCARTRRDSSRPARSSRVFLILVIGYLLSLAVGMVIQIPFAILQQIVMFREAAAGQIADPAALMAKMTLFQVPGGLPERAGHDRGPGLHGVRA